MRNSKNPSPHPTTSLSSIIHTSSDSFHTSLSSDPPPINPKNPISTPLPPKVNPKNPSLNLQPNSIKSESQGVPKPLNILLKKLVRASTRSRYGLNIQNLKSKASKKGEYTRRKILGKQKMKTVKEMMFEKDLAAIYLENKGMTFSSEDSETSHKSSDTSNESKERKRYRYKPKREKTAWNKITNFILNEDPNIFRRILRGMNTQFYEDFEDTALRAYKLDDLKPEDFNALKKIGIRRMNQTSLKTALMNDSGSEDEHIDPFKQVRDKEETVKELVRTRTLLKDKDIVVVEKPQIYTDLINAYRKCKETGYQPKRSFQQKIAEVHKANIDFKAEAAINK